MCDFLGIYIKKLDDGGFKFCQTGLIQKVMESAGMKHCNRLPTTTKFEGPLGTDDNSFDYKRYFTN